MRDSPASRRMLLVDEQVLPEVFRRVLQAKQLLDTGQVKSATGAATAVGISRSVFYKYKDAVFSYHSDTGARIVTLSVVLHDHAGVLAGFIGELTAAGANILTINQSIPVGHIAAVNVSLRTEGLTLPLEDLIIRLRDTPGLVSIEQVSGE